MKDGIVIGFTEKETKYEFPQFGFRGIRQEVGTTVVEDSTPRIVILVVHAPRNVEGAEGRGHLARGQRGARHHEVYVYSS
jgi:hypothetical protein